MLERVLLICERSYWPSNLEFDRPREGNCSPGSQSVISILSQGLSAWISFIHTPAQTMYTLGISTVYLQSHHITLTSHLSHACFYTSQI